MDQLRAISQPHLPSTPGFKKSDLTIRRSRANHDRHSFTQSITTPDDIVELSITCRNTICPVNRYTLRFIRAPLLSGGFSQSNSLVRQLPSVKRLQLDLYHTTRFKPTALRSWIFTAPAQCMMAPSVTTAPHPHSQITSATAFQPSLRSWADVPSHRSICSPSTSTCVISRDQSTTSTSGKRWTDIASLHILVY